MFPENTMPAFEGAYEAGFSGIELDVWESRKGDIMVFHDSTTGRMCQGKSNKIWNVNASSRTKSRYLIPYNDGTTVIPTLQEVLKTAGKHPGTILIHIKPKTGKYSLSKAGVKKIIRLIKKYKVKDRAVVFSSSESDMKRFVKKGVRVGMQTSRLSRKKINKSIRWLQKNKGDTLVITRMTGIRQDDCGRKLVKYCHKRGIQIGTYYTLTYEDYEYLSSIGADFAMSDWYLPDQDN